MNPTYTTPKSIALVLVFLFVVTGIAAADEELSGLSGKVVDLEGNAVAGFTFGIQPVQLHDGFLEPQREFPASLAKGETDSGSFHCQRYPAGACSINRTSRHPAGCV